MQTLNYKFEELPDFWEGDFRSGAHNGFAEISYSHTGEWYVSGVSLECHNGKLGAAAQGQHIQLVHYHPVRAPLVAALEHFSYDYIQDRVNEARVLELEAAE